METETLEKIEEMGTPKERGPLDFKRKFKFRVSFRARMRGAAKPSEGSFSYFDYDTARRCYRKILLAFYRGKEVDAFAICLNRHGSKKWEEPLHMESGDESA